MNDVEDMRQTLVRELIVAFLLGSVVAGVVTYLVNRRRRTATLARATLLLALWGLGTFGVSLLLAIPTGHMALRQIRRSGAALKGKIQAWIGLACGYALLLMLLLQVGLAVGDVTRDDRNLDRERRVVEAIEKSKAAWALANGKKAGDIPTDSELGPFMPGGQFPPSSVEGERYEINPLGVKACVIRPPAEF